MKTFLFAHFGSYVYTVKNVSCYNINIHRMFVPLAVMSLWHHYTGRIRFMSENTLNVLKIPFKNSYAPSSLFFDNGQNNFGQAQMLAVFTDFISP